MEAEKENIVAQVAMGNALEELAALELSDPVEEVTELDYLLEGAEEGDAELCGPPAVAFLHR